MEHGATADGLPALNRQEIQKAREWAYLLRFRDSCANFPEGEIVPSERPDFLIQAQPQRTGIEITEYHVQELNEGRGSPMRAQESTEDKVLRTASERHQSKGLPPVAVDVLWHPHQPFSSRRTQELAVDLADLVQEYLPERGHSVHIRRRRHPAGRSLPQEVASLRVDRQIDFLENAWVPLRTAFVPTLTPAELQKIMRDKEARVRSYRQECEEVWLLIVARGFEPSTFGELGPEVEGYLFESGFDRVFFLHYFDEAVTELRVRRAA